MDVLWPVGVMQRLLCRCRHEVTGALEFESRARWRKGKESLGRLLMDEPLPIFDQRRKLLGTDHDLALRGRGRFTNRPYGCVSRPRGWNWAWVDALCFQLGWCSPVDAAGRGARCGAVFGVMVRGRSWYSDVP